MIAAIYLTYIFLLLLGIAFTIMRVGKHRLPVTGGEAAIAVLLTILQGVIATMLYYGVIQ